MPPQDPMTELANFFQGVSVETSEPTIEKPVSKTIKSSDYLVDTQNPTVINKANVGKIVSEMTYDEASEYFDFNIAGSHMGVYTPLYLET